MFWERFYSLCLEHNTKPNPVAKAVGISSGTVNKWKNGAIPNAEFLLKIAKHFDCSTDYLLGLSEIKKPPTSEEVDGNNITQDELNHLLDSMTLEQLQQLWNRCGTQLIKRKEQVDK